MVYREKEEVPRGRYLLVTTDGYSLDEYAFYDTFEEAQAAMKEAYERSSPDDWIESDAEMSRCGEWDAILYNNGEDVFVWNIINIMKQ